MISVSPHDTMWDSGDDAVVVHTDFEDPSNRSFYLRPDTTPIPVQGSIIIYGDDHAWYMVDGVDHEAHKKGYNFDPAKFH